jgi:hypothetical protein
MADETFPLRYKLKRKTTAQWASQNPVLLAGEPGIEVLSDGSEKIKYGDGVKTWSALNYAAGGGSGPALSSATPQALGASAAPGSSVDASRADHVHPRPTAGQVGADASGTAAAAVAAHEAAADPHPGYLTPAEGNAAYATAAQGALAATAIQPGNAALSDSREWSADTISQAEAEAGIATTRRAFTALRVFQAIASWWNGSAAKTKLDGIASSATANSSDATLLNRANHTGTQLSSTISDLNTVLAGYQPVDSDLTALAALSTTSYGRSLLALADAAAGRTALGLGTLATQSGTFSGTSSGTNTGDQATNLSYDAATRNLASSTGDDATLPLVITSAAGLSPATAFDAITYGATVDLSMLAMDGTFKTISLTGNLTFTTSNRANGRTVTIRLVCDSTQRTLTFPTDWKFVGSKPANIAASKVAVLSLTFFGATDADCIGAYGVQS